MPEFVPVRPILGKAEAAHGRHLTTLQRALLLAAVYYLAARLGLGFRFNNSQIGVVWPANAVLLAALLLTRRAWWWLVLAVAAVAHIIVMFGVVPPWRWLWQLLTNWLFVVGTALLVCRFAGRPLQFGNRRQVITYTAIVFGTSAIFGCSTPAFFRSLLGLEVIGPVAAVFHTMMSNATALLLVTPTIVLWANDRPRGVRRIARRRYLEASVIMLALLLACALALASGPDIARHPWLPLMIFTPLLAAAVRFGPKGAVTSLFFVAAISVWATARQLGPFVLMEDTTAVLSLQLFWLVLAAPVLLLAAAIREREQAEVELLRQRNQLAHVSRVATVGTLSGTLAHELGQPLASILANAQAGLRILAREPVDLVELREILQDIAQHDKQAADVILHCHALLKQSDGKLEAVAVDRVVREALVLGRGLIKTGHVDVRLVVADELPAVRGDRVQLLQVVLNLIVNACDAMSARPPRDRHLSLEVTRSGQQVEIVITDTGLGLPTDDAESVFEPFYTTKDKGLGLGLAIGRSIARAQGGQLRAENNPEGGATFRLQLPAYTSHR